MNSLRHTMNLRPTSIWALPLLTLTGIAIGCGGDSDETATSGSGGAGGQGGSMLTCDDGKLACGDVCVDSNTDSMNCGACGTVCEEGNVCVEGKCDLDCADGTTKCVGDDMMSVCANTQTDTAHCGACGVACEQPANASATCVDAMCGFECAEMFADCDSDATTGCEIDSATDAANCGACGNACASDPNGTPSCTAGACGIVCNEGYSECGGACVDKQSDVLNCGSCGNACAAKEICKAGACFAPNKACYNDFSVGYGNGDLNYYKNNGWGTTFSPANNWLGGDKNGDPGNWDVPDEAWGRTPKALASITFSAAATDVSFILRGNGWSSGGIVIKSYLNNVEQESQTVNTSGSYTTFNVGFAKTLDQVTIDSTNSVSSFPVSTLAPVILDNLKYTGPFECAVVQP